MLKQSKQTYDEVYVLRHKKTGHILRYHSETFELTIDKSPMTLEVGRKTLEQISNLAFIATRISAAQATKLMPYCPEGLDLTEFEVVLFTTITTVDSSEIVMPVVEPVFFNWLQWHLRPVRMLKLYFDPAPETEVDKFDAIIAELPEGMSLEDAKKLKGTTCFITSQIESLHRVQILGITEVPDFFQEDNYSPRQVLICGVATAVHGE
jgi:hypothetical protein